MRKIEDYFEDRPKSLQYAVLIKEGIAARVLRDKRVDKKDYNRKGAKEKLLEIFAHCCAFCEKRVDKYADIEHFRPKHDIIDVLNTLGYYWLGFEWSNFLLACKECNGQEHKGNHFPINSTRVNTPSSIDFNDYQQVSSFFARCHIRSVELQAEQPLLLHPVLDNPDDYLVFEKNGTVTAKNNEEKGRISIETYGLSDLTKRPMLIHDRKQIVEMIRKEVQHISRHYVNEDRLYEDLRAIHVGLLRDLAKNKPFSAVRRACLEQFKTFFIDDFEGEPLIRLNGAYDKLKNKLIQ